MNAYSSTLSSHKGFIGQVTEVRNNYTLEIDNKTLVKLTLLDSEINKTQIVTDATHFVSVVCPIRSPALVYPDFHNISEQPQQNSKNSEVTYALVFCNYTSSSGDPIFDFSFDNQNNKTIDSINESLVKAGLAFLDLDHCKSSSYANQTWARLDGCDNVFIK